jgi:hypothetical protein
MDGRARHGRAGQGSSGGVAMVKLAADQRVTDEWVISSSMDGNAGCSLSSGRVTADLGRPEREKERDRWISSLHVGPHHVHHPVHAES